MKNITQVVTYKQNPSCNIRETHEKQNPSCNIRETHEKHNPSCNIRETHENNQILYIFITSIYSGAEFKKFMETKQCQTTSSAVN